MRPCGIVLAAVLLLLTACGGAAPLPSGPTGTPSTEPSTPLPQTATQAAAQFCQAWYRGSPEVKAMMTPNAVGAANEPVANRGVSVRRAPPEPLGRQADGSLGFIIDAAVNGAPVPANEVFLVRQPDGRYLVERVIA